jgi:hypothetical protein
MLNTTPSTAFLRHLCLFFISVLVPIWAQAQVIEVAANPDSVDAEIAAYNAQRMEFEYMLKERECTDDVKQLKASFERELRQIDSLLGTITIDKIPDAYTGKFIIISPHKKEDGCLYLTYAKKKYPKGCQIAFYPDSVDFGAYPNFQKALTENKLCIIKMDGSGFTQVEKIQNADVSEKSAADLLAMIKRTTDLYSDVLGVTYPQYLAYEKSKNLSTLKQVVSIRVQFLNLSKERIKK